MASSKEINNPTGESHQFIILKGTLRVGESISCEHIWIHF